MRDATLTDYTLEKALWTDADFEQMGWHDSHIHAIAFRLESFLLLLDIDYIFRWVEPAPKETHYKFWLSPCTLMFKNVYQLRISLEPLEDVSIQDITRSAPEQIKELGTANRYAVECNEGEITFRPTGYEQFIHRLPTLVSSQRFTEEERGGFSFACITPDIIKRRS
jgi:hypothetical protein